MRVDDYGVVWPKPKKEFLVNLNELAKVVAEATDLPITIVKQAIKHISIAVYDDPDTCHLLIRNGKKWARNYKPKAKK